MSVWDICLFIGSALAAVCHQWGTHLGDLDHVTDLLNATAGLLLAVGTIWRVVFGEHRTKQKKRHKKKSR